MDVCWRCNGPITSHVLVNIAVDVEQHIIPKNGILKVNSFIMPPTTQYISEVMILQEYILSKLGLDLGCRANIGLDKVVHKFNDPKIKYMRAQKQ